MGIIETLEDILAGKYQIKAKLEPGSHLIDEFGFDSISMVELSVELSKRYKKKIPVNQAALWTTVESIEETIKTV